MTTALATRPASVDYDAELKAASLLIRGGLTPKDIRTPEAALFCILAGRDLGMSPVQSLRCIRPVQGKLEVSADAQLGLFVQAGGRFAWEEITPQRAAITLHAPWLIKPHTSEFTIEDAHRAKLSGVNWTSYPKAMLRSRAITQGLKDIGFLQGAQVYAPGELGGAVEVTAEGEVVTVADEPVVMDVAYGKPSPAQGKKPLTDYTDSELQQLLLDYAENPKAVARIRLEAEGRGLTLTDPDDLPA